MKKQLSASSSILYRCILLVVGVVVAASSQPNNLRGGIKSEDGYDFIDCDISTIDFDNLPCHMLTDQRPNTQCEHQGKDCAAQGKECYVINSASRPIYGCGDPKTCDNPNER